MAQQTSTAPVQQIQLTGDWAVKARRLADLRGVTPTAIVQQALTAFIDKHHPLLICQPPAERECEPKDEHTEMVRIHAFRDFLGGWGYEVICADSNRVRASGLQHPRPPRVWLSSKQESIEAGRARAAQMGLEVLT